MQGDARLEHIDGLPVLLVPSAGRPRCGLVFRVGRADETLTTAGTTHLVEHLVMDASARTRREANAHVDVLTTTFLCSGTGDELARFLESVGDALSALPVHRLEIERRILQTEAAMRMAGPPAEMLACRFGPQTYGLPAYDELGLSSAGPADLTRWAHTRFTRQNALLWTTTPLPSALRLDLPDGERVPPPDPHSLEPLPARFAAELALGLDCVAERSAALDAGWRILQGRLFDTLRLEHGLVYDVDAEVTAVGTGLGHYSMLTDPLPESRYRAGQLLADVLGRLLDDGVDAAEVHEDAASRLGAAADAEAALWSVDDDALDVLLGRCAGTGVVQPAHAPTETEVTDALRRACESALHALPDEVIAGRTLHTVPRWSTAGVTGRTHELRDARSARSPVTLVVGQQGAMVRLGAQDRVTVRYDGCAALLSWGDGTRHLVGHDGHRVVVEPWDWSGGDEAVRSIDAAVPPALVVDMGAGEGPPAPDRPETGFRVGRYVLWALVSLVFVAFALTSTSPTDSGPAGPLADLGCDRATSLQVLVAGPGPRVAGGRGQDYDTLREACERSATSDVAFGLLGGLSLIGCAATAAARARSR